MNFARGSLVFIFLWAWIVHAAARRALQYDEWVAEDHVGKGLSNGVRGKLRDDFYYPALFIPPVLGLGIIASVAHAIWLTRDSLAGAEAGLVEARSAIDLTTALLWGVLASAFLYTVLVGLHMVLAWKCRKRRPPPSLNSSDSTVPPASKGLRARLAQAPLLAGVPTLLERLLSPSEYRKRVVSLGHSPLDMALNSGAIRHLGCSAVCDPRPGRSRGSSPAAVLRAVAAGWCRRIAGRNRRLVILSASTALAHGRDPFNHCNVLYAPVP